MITGLFLWRARAFPLAPIFTGLEDGDDTITIYDGKIIGGGGNNTLVNTGVESTIAYWNSPQGVTVNLATGKASNGFGGSDAIAGFDRVFGSANNDTLIGNAGNNIFAGLGGNDTVIGGGGLQLAPKAAGVPMPLAGVERILFSDGALALDASGNGGKIYRVYQAAFDRKPDVGGVGYWLAQMDNGASLLDVVNGFLKSNEFADLYGLNPAAEIFVAKLYNNVLHRAPEPAGYDYWLNDVKAGADRAEVLAAFSVSTENQLQVIRQMIREYLERHDVQYATKVKIGSR